MKFRALQWDYHAEAVQVESENEKRRKKMSKRDTKEDLNQSTLKRSSPGSEDNNGEQVPSLSSSALPSLLSSDSRQSNDTMAWQDVDTEVRALNNQSNLSNLLLSAVIVATTTYSYLSIPFLLLLWSTATTSHAVVSPS